MRSWVLVVGLIGVGCQHTSAPVARVAASPAPVVEREPVVAVQESPPAPAQAPSQAEAAPASWLDQLPALSDDGSTVAIANHQTLGGRGEERLLLDFVDVRSDRLVRRIIVSDPDAPGAQLGAEAKARRVLAERSWNKLTPYAVDDDPHAPVRDGGVSGPVQDALASGEGLVVQYREPLLVVRDAAGGAELLHRKQPAWSEIPHTCPGCDTCPAPLARTGAVWGSRDRHVLLVGLTFTGGSDVCWEPSTEYHVVVLP